jgi:hypothetical protein
MYGKVRHRDDGEHHSEGIRHVSLRRQPTQFMKHQAADRLKFRVRRKLKAQALIKRLERQRRIDF